MRLTKKEKETFLGTEYKLNQCDDLCSWFMDSRIGEYTNYYDKVIFHTIDGFYAAYRDDLGNNWMV